MKVTAIGGINCASSVASQAGSAPAAVRPIPAVRNRRRDNDDKELVEVPTTCDTEMTCSVTTQRQRHKPTYTTVVPSTTRKKTALMPPVNHGSIEPSI